MTQPIHIDLKQFILEGKFANVTMGQNKSVINECFLPAISDNEMGNNLSISLYQGIEFHFDGDMLFTIWCDNLAYIKNTKKLIFNKWIVDDLDRMSLVYAIKIFSDEFVNFSIRFDNNLNNAVLKIRKSGVELWFENTSENDMCIPSEYQLVAIGLSHHDFDIFERNF